VEDGKTSRPLLSSHYCWHGEIKNFTEAFAQYVISLGSVPSLFEWFYLCRIFKFILFSSYLEAFLYTSRV
jgi:hypothetical protein